MLQSAASVKESAPAALFLPSCRGIRAGFLGCKFLGIDDAEIAVTA